MDSLDAEWESFLNDNELETDSSFKTNDKKKHMSIKKL